MMAARSKKVRVRFQDNEGREEFLNVTALEGELYRLEESPAFAYSVSLADVVKVKPGPEGQLEFAEVAERSGNRTVRIILARFSAASKEAKPILKQLKKLGCSYQNSHPNVLSITLPPGTPLEEIVEYLKSLKMWWEHADPTFDDLYGDSPLEGG